MRNYRSLLFRLKLSNNPNFSSKILGDLPEFHYYFITKQILQFLRVPPLNWPYPSIRRARRTTAQLFHNYVTTYSSKPPPSLFRCIQFRLWFEPLVCRVIPSILSRSFHKRASLLSRGKRRKKEKETNSSTDASHYASSYVTTINGWVINVDDTFHRDEIKILFLFFYLTKIMFSTSICRDLFDMRYV